jgi:hypothetical protein
VFPDYQDHRECLALQAPRAFQVWQDQQDLKACLDHQGRRDYQDFRS